MWKANWWLCRLSDVTMVHFLYFLFWRRGLGGCLPTFCLQMFYVSGSIFLSNDGGNLWRMDGRAELNMMRFQKKNESTDA